MRYSIKLILKKAPKDEGQNPVEKNGKRPIYLRITIDRKVRYISTGHFILSKFWDEKNELVKDSHLLASIINPDITNKKQNALREIVNSQINKESINSDQLKERLTGKSSTNNFFDFVDHFISEVKNKRTKSTLNNYRKHTKKLQDFHGSRNLSFEMIDRKLLTAYENHLHQTVGVNYISSLITTIRTLFNAAKKQGLVKHYPFDNFEMPRYLAPGKEYLTLPEIKLLEDYKPKDQFKHQVARWFLVACYTGLRWSDWKKLTIRDNLVYLRAKKNNEWITMPISGGLKRTLKDLPELTKAEPQVNGLLKEIFKELGINKSISTHCGRHTFAITCCAERGVSCETCAELMGITVATCVESYYRVTNKKIMDETAKAWKGL